MLWAQLMLIMKQSPPLIYMPFSNSVSVHRREQTGTLKQTLICAIGGVWGSRNGAIKKLADALLAVSFSKDGDSLGAVPELSYTVVREVEHIGVRGGETVMYISTSSKQKSRFYQNIDWAVNKAAWEF